MALTFKWRKVANQDCATDPNSWSAAHPLRPHPTHTPPKEDDVYELPTSEYRFMLVGPVGAIGEGCFKSICVSKRLMQWR